MELNVPSVHPRGQFWHSLAGTLSVFIGNGLLLAPVENYKTALQLKIFRDRAEHAATKDHEPEILDLFSGTLACFWRQLVFTGSKVLGNHIVDHPLRDHHNFVLPAPAEGIAGVVLGTILSYPYDIVRTRQAVAVFAAPLQVVDRKISIVRLVNEFSWNGLFQGVEVALLLNVSQQIIAKAAQQVINNSSFTQQFLSTLIRYGSPSGDDVTFRQRITWCLGYTLAKILLTPLEVAKKRIQHNLKHSSQYQPKHHLSNTTAVAPSNSLFDVLGDIYNQDGISGLFAGWYLGVPEALVTVLATHYVFRGVVAVTGRE